MDACEKIDDKKRTGQRQGGSQSPLGAGVHHLC